jgi:hypothetical protein
MPVTVTITYSCGGCSAKATAPEQVIRSEFVSLSGHKVASLAPEGWVPFDPYTGCCYCPACWTAIETGIGNRPTCTPNSTTERGSHVNISDLPSKRWRVSSPDGLSVDCRTMAAAYVQVAKLTQKMRLRAAVEHWEDGAWRLYERVEPVTDQPSAPMAGED